MLGGRGRLWRRLSAGWEPTWPMSLTRSSAHKWPCSKASRCQVRRCPTEWSSNIVQPVVSYQRQSIEEKYKWWKIQDQPTYSFLNATIFLSAVVANDWQNYQPLLHAVLRILIHATLHNAHVISVIIATIRAWNICEKTWRRKAGRTPGIYLWVLFLDATPSSVTLSVLLQVLIKWQ
jgi:hypothetical protein